MICPLCKYEPKYKKNGEVRCNYIDFAWFRVSKDCEAHPIWDEEESFFVCPKCGIVFADIRKAINNVE